MSAFRTEPITRLALRERESCRVLPRLPLSKSVQMVSLPNLVVRGGFDGRRSPRPLGDLNDQRARRRLTHGN